MAQPYDYSSLVGGFQSPQQAFVDAVKMRDLYVQEQKAKQEEASLRADLAALQANPTPQAYAAFYLKHPKMKEQVEAYRQTLTEADNRFIVDTAQEAFLLNRAGKTDAVLSLFDERIEALKNSGRKDMIDAAKRARRLYEIAPDQKSRENALGMILYNYGGGETYEKVWGFSENTTSFQKDLMAAGIDPNGAEGRSLSEQYARGRADPIVEIETPDGSGIFRGPFSEYQRRYGYAAGAAGPAKQPQSQARVFSNVTALPADLKSGDIVNGKRYLGGPTNQASSWAAPEGGQMGAPAPSGSFQGK